MTSGVKSEVINAEYLDGTWVSKSLIPIHLAELIDSFLRNTETDWTSLAEDPGCRGQGLCLDASEELAEFLRLKAIKHVLIFSYLPADRGPFTRYNQYSDGGHWSCMIRLGDRQWLVDLTARQFQDDFDFPSYYAVSGLK